MRGKTFVERIASLRELTAMSASELDGLAGLPRGHTWVIESRDGNRVAARTIDQIARVFGVSLDWIFAGRGTMPDTEQVRGAVSRLRRARAKRDAHSAKLGG